MQQNYALISNLRKLFLAFTLITVESASALAQTENVLYTFKSFGDGFNVGGAPLVLDPAGNLYGTTTNGGSFNCQGSYVGCGTIYQLARPSRPDGAWVKNEIWRFQGGVDGGYPAGVLIQDGKLVGEAGTGGNGACSGGCGYLFQLTPPAVVGGAWTKTVLYDFPEAAAECGISIADASGNFFGVGGSSNGNGSVCKINRPTKPGGSWSTTTLYTFTGVAPHHSIGDGSGPLSVTFDQQGNLWGATLYGGYCQQFEGGSCFGTIFKLTPPEQGATWNETLLYRLRPGDQNPTSGVTIDSSGAVFGITYTEVYQLVGSTFSVIDNFPDVTGNAHSPTGGVVLGPAGDLYGVTGGGGQFNDGTVYKLTRPENGTGYWTQAILYSFSGGTDGFNPEVAPTLGAGGVLYGFTQNGGDHGCNMGGENVGCGVIYAVNP